MTLANFLRAVFESSCNEDEVLNFNYLSNLQKVNHTFCWDGTAFLSLHRSIMYVAVGDEHKLSHDLTSAISDEAVAATKKHESKDCVTAVRISSLGNTLLQHKTIINLTFSVSKFFVISQP